ncbi:UNVERIFIED_CONTAM: hypothetical protein Scaly_1632700 [Sesamum calycinum]|uniref:DUF4283 domain-containing protein n=1 Tax=Sesamum calycinum TaxID=2727403 RepID=A0AAW2P8K0_9LAMI
MAKDFALALKTKKLDEAPACPELGQPSTISVADGQMTPISVKAHEASMPTTAPVSAKRSTTGAQVGATDFQGFISELESSPSFVGKSNHGHGHRPKDILPAKETLPAKEATTGAGGMAKPSFAGLFSTNHKLSDENKLTKFAVELETLELGTDDLIDVRTKLGGWLIFRFAQDDDRQWVLADGPYFVYGRPLFLKAMPDCFEFNEDGISLTPVWATLPSLPLERWHPNALGKIGSRLGMPISMDLLTMKMERVSYARISVEVDASKPLIDQVDFMLPNGVMRSQPVVYEFTPKFCKKCNRFGHLEGSCQDAQLTAAGAAKLVVPAVNDHAGKDVQGQPAGKDVQGQSVPLTGKDVQGQSVALASKEVKGQPASLAGKNTQGRTGTSKAQQNLSVAVQKPNAQKAGFGHNR